MRVDFAFNADDRIAQAVRTTVKQVARGERVIVYCPLPARLTAYDNRLWSLEDTIFIAHERLDQSARPGLSVYLVDDQCWEQAQPLLAGGAWLLNLHDDCPALPNPAQRILEVVSSDEADRVQARARWRRYQQAGLQLHAHQLDPGAR